MVEQTDKAGAWFFAKTNKIDRSLGNLVKKIKKITSVRN